MGSELNELNDLLKGEHHAANKGAPEAAAAGAGVSGLNQLSDAAAAAEIEVKPPAAQAAQPVAAPVVVTATAARSPASLALPSQGYSQEQLIEAAQPMQFQQPSQPDIPPPIIPESQGASQPVQINAEDAKNALLGSNGIDITQPYFMNLMAAGGFGGLNPMGVGMGDYMTYASLAGFAPPEDDTQQLPARVSKGKKQTRRGPMDEMRQLIRILVKIFPHSINLISNTEEAGGGNRISEDQIKSYLEAALGEAPQPAWGVPTSGWNGYLAELFSWATGKVVTGEECKRVARREPGRSWEALESELHNIGVHPSCWPLPLTLAKIRKAEEKPVPIDIPKVPAVKRSSAAGEDGGAGGATTTGGTVVNKRARSAIERDLNKMDENDVWRFINDALKIAENKTGTGYDQQLIHTAKVNAKNKIDEMLGANGAAAGGMGSMYPYIPVMAGQIDPSILNSLMQNGTIPGFDPNDPNQAAALAAAAAATGMDGSNFAAAANAAAGGGVPPPAKRVKQEGGEAAEGTPAALEAGAVAAAQLGTLPMQLPPLNVPNIHNLASYIPNNLQNLAACIPSLNVSMPMAAPEVANGAPAPGQPEQPKQD
ncbi:hypothetical protein Ndes2526B_g08322 [Nannochloris sp. 'desiccata']|nr:hypothetical protein KSW81_001788 [Chlorella desiccata (nom. nud.)]KAH7616221.1 hypothetical protein NADE_001049 [Chlorella desiccata (nom. nud.)]